MREVAEVVKFSGSEVSARRNRGVDRTSQFTQDLKNRERERALKKV